MKKGLVEKIKTIPWYLKRPRLYPELLRKIKKDIIPAKKRNEANGKAIAEAWCAERAISEEEAIFSITGQEILASIEAEYSEVFIQAKQVVQSCPVEMGSQGALDLLYRLSEHICAKKVVETGVAYGWSSLAILLSISKRSDSLLVSTDMPYPNRNNDHYVGCAVPQKYRSNWKVINRADRDALFTALNMLKEIDLCHYDSDKSYDGRMWAYPVLWNALRKGGIFISDDIADNVAFRDFVNTLKMNPVIVKVESEKYVGILLKPS